VSNDKLRVGTGPDETGSLSVHDIEIDTCLSKFSATMYFLLLWTLIYYSQNCFSWLPSQISNCMNLWFCPDRMEKIRPVPTQDKPHFNRKDKSLRNCRTIEMSKLLDIIMILHRLEQNFELTLNRDLRDQRKQRLFYNSFQSGCKKITSVDVLCLEF